MPEITQQEMLGFLDSHTLLGRLGNQVKVTTSNVYTFASVLCSSQGHALIKHGRAFKLHFVKQKKHNSDLKTYPNSE
ncbi:hypothetical protein JHK86_006930 [Glycine max]|nr:hypothetical protein JHK86_006930 [Glycine max]